MQIEFQKINEVYSRIRCETSLLFELIDDFAFFVDGYKFMPSYKRGHWDGKIRYVQQNGLFYNGLLKRVWEKCKSKGYSDFIFTDYEKNPEYTEQLIDDKLELFNLDFDFHPHQIEAITESLTKRKRIILSPTSSGKSLISYSISRILAEDNNKVLILVPSVMLVNQLYSDFEDYAKNDQSFAVDDNVHKVSAGIKKYTDKQIIISTWQSISALKDGKDTSKVREYMEQFDAIIGDETHKYAANEVKLMMESAINARYRIGLTGTLDEVKSSIETLEGLFGKVHRVLSTRELIDSGMATDVKIYPCILEYHDDFRKTMSSEISKLYKAKQKTSVNKAYQYEIDTIISNKNRNEFIAKLVKNLTGNTVILTRYIENHAKPLAEIISKYTNKKVIILDKDTPADIREETRKELANINDAVIIASYSLIATGVNIPSLQNIIFACPTKSKIPVLQAIGRVLRLHKLKTIAKVFDIVDDYGYNGNETYVMKHFQSRFEYYSQEQFEIEFKKFQLGDR